MVRGESGAGRALSLVVLGVGEGVRKRSSLGTGVCIAVFSETLFLALRVRGAFPVRFDGGAPGAASGVYHSNCWAYWRR